MDKFKRFLLYFLLTIIILVFLYLGIRYEVTLRIQTGKNYNPAKYYLFSALFPILFGIILALPNLIREYKKLGKWSIDWIKLLAIGVPNLLLNLSLILIAYTPIRKSGYFSTYNPFTEVMVVDKTVISLCGIVFGFILISSFNKIRESK